MKNEFQHVNINHNLEDHSVDARANSTPKVTFRYPFWLLGFLRRHLG